MPCGAVCAHCTSTSVTFWLGVHNCVSIQLAISRSVTSDMGNSSSGGTSGGDFPHDVGTQSGLTNIYNQQVCEVQHVSRPMGSSGGSANVPFFNHQGAVVTTNTGDRYLVHKGDGYGKSSQTVVVDARHMSDKWTFDKPRSVSGHTVSDFVKVGGADYKLGRDDCRHASDRGTNLGKPPAR